MAKNSDEQLSERWNAIGRAHMGICSKHITEFYGGIRASVPDTSDPRDRDLSEAILDRVRDLNRTGAWRQARQLFDPAWEPFLHLLDANGQNLPFATILGPDYFLVRLGTEYESGNIVLIDGETVTPLVDAVACAISPNRRFLATAYTGRGLIVQERFGGPVIAEIAWPDPDARIPRALPNDVRNRWERHHGAPTISDLRICDDGQRLLLVSADEGVLLVDRRRGSAEWTVVLPDYGWSHDVDTLRELHSDNAPTDSYYYFGDMVHADLSPDGSFAAVGEQDSQHYIVELAGRDSPGLYAKIGPQVDYPHFARFSCDGRKLALNSCHFYSGATSIVDVFSARGWETEPYQRDDRVPIIDENLRVYAAAWLPPEAVKRELGAFVLAGAGWMRGVTPSGEVLWDQLFGSSASSLDYCPETNRLILGSYSGMLHILDPSSEAGSGREIGYRPRNEIKRWIFWRNEDQPLQW